MKVTRDAYLISDATLLMVFTLLTVDVYKVINLPFFGMLHWVPELLAIFLLSNYIAKNFESKTRWLIFACATVFPLLVYRSTFGAFTSCIFSTAMLVGFLSVDIKKYLKVKKIDV